MKIEMSDPNFMFCRCRRSGVCSPDVLRICFRKDGFVFLGAEQIDSVNSVIFIGELEEVAIKSWLRCYLGAGDLDFLPKGLDTLLFPEY